MPRQRRGSRDLRTERRPRDVMDPAGRLQRPRRQPHDGAVRRPALLRFAAGQGHRPRPGPGRGARTHAAFPVRDDGGGRQDVHSVPAQGAGRSCIRGGPLHQRRRPPPPSVMDARLYVILDRVAARGRDLLSILDATLAGGCRLVQLREKEWPSGRLLSLAERLRDRCRAAGATFVVNDRLDLALALGADGVHLGQDDLPPAAARPLLRPGMILGLSTHSLEQARAAQAAGADYVAVGSMFHTGTKPDFELVGPQLVAKLRPEIRAPLIGIGGITHDNVAQVIRAGADGVAVISAVCAAADPEAATRRFLEVIESARYLTTTQRRSL